MSIEEIEEDFLEVDQPIPGQNYVCLSFVSPEKIIKQKEVYFMKKFMHELLTNESKRKFLLEMNPEDLTYAKVDSMIEDYRVVNEKNVNTEFDGSVDFQTSVRGIKVRGVYDTLKEAKNRSASLQRKDSRFNIFLGQIGYWLPWDPSNVDSIDSEYQNKHLNEIVKNYQINAEERDMFYEQDKQEKIQKAIKENLKKKEENIALGHIDPTKEPQGDTKAKIDELRETLDRKDKLYNAVLKDNNVNNASAGGTEKVAIVGDDTVEDANETKPEAKPDDEFSTGTHADPWMQRKSEGTEEIPVQEGVTETVTHNAEDVSGQTDDGLKEVTKNIF